MPCSIDSTVYLNIFYFRQPSSIWCCINWRGCKYLQLQNETFEEEKQQQQQSQQISNDQFQELLNGINFDEPVEESKPIQPENIELVTGIDFVEPIEEEKGNNQIPILLPFCSTEKKQDNEMCNKISSTSSTDFNLMDCDIIQDENMLDFLFKGSNVSVTLLYQCYIF